MSNEQAWCTDYHKFEERVNYIYILGIIQNVVWSDQVYTHLMVIIKCLVVLQYGWVLIKNLFNSGTIQTFPYQPATTYSLLYRLIFDHKCDIESKLFQSY